MSLFTQHYTTSTGDRVSLNEADQLFIYLFIYIFIYILIRCNIVLGEFLNSIRKDPSCVDFAGMINIMIAHSQASDEILQVICEY
jgi:hypothetical protein